MQAFHRWTWIKPKARVGSLLSLGLWVVLSSPVGAERLRISPDDLRLRVVVSQELSPALRREILELARSVPLPLTDGVLQTEELFLGKFQDRGWSEKSLTLTRYYFLIARMEQSQQFSDEFLRRRTVMREGVRLLESYVETLNPLIARASYSENGPSRAAKVQDFPLQEAVLEESGELRVLHLYPAPKLSMGRESLRSLREQAGEEKEILKEQMELLDKAEREFLDEISLIGTEVLALRKSVQKWVRVPREGLPFSP